MKFSSMIFAIGMIAVFTSPIYAVEPNNKPCNAHNWHTVSTQSGVWKASLQVINEVDNAWFLAPNCSKINSFAISAKNSEKFGFAFDDKTDFNVAYTLTLVKQDEPSLTYMSSKSCIFVITANGPAKPDIRSLSYNGANCDWQRVPGVGNDFFVG